MNKHLPLLSGWNTSRSFNGQPTVAASIEYDTGGFEK